MSPRRGFSNIYIVKRLEVHSKGRMTIILYSDCCQVRNRNVEMTLNILKYASNHKQKLKLLIIGLLYPDIYIYQMDLTLER